MPTMEQPFPPEATEFAVSAIESTARRLGVKGDIVYKALCETDGVRRFLFPSYGALHTQGMDRIVDEVIEYLSARGSGIVRRNEP